MTYRIMLADLGEWEVWWVVSGGDVQLGGVWVSLGLGLGPGSVAFVWCDGCEQAG